MHDIFISYARESRERALDLANQFIARGWTVWWDQNLIPGDGYGRVIQREIEAAKCVVVLWSEESILSEWVRNEASAAMDRGVLIPVLLEDVQPPLEFRHLQAADLRGWEGDPSHPGFRALFDAVANKIGGTPVHPPTQPARPRWNRFWMAGTTLQRSLWIVALLGILLPLGAIYGRRVFQRSEMDSAERDVRNEWVARVGRFETKDEARRAKAELSAIMAGDKEPTWLTSLHIARDIETSDHYLLLIDMFKGVSSQEAVAAEIQRLRDQHPRGLGNALEAAHTLYYRKSSFVKQYGKFSPTALDCYEKEVR